MTLSLSAPCPSILTGWAGTAQVARISHQEPPCWGSLCQRLLQWQLSAGRISWDEWCNSSSNSSSNSSRSQSLLTPRGWSWGSSSATALLGQCVPPHGLGAPKSELPSLAVTKFLLQTLPQWGRAMSCPCHLGDSSSSSSSGLSQTLPASPSSRGHISLLGELISLYVFYARLLQLLFRVLWDERLL